MRLARLDEATRVQILGRFSAEQVEALMHDWGFWSRPEQRFIDLTARVVFVETGRGFGKTRSLSEWIHERVDRGSRFGGLVGRTAGDLRDVLIEGKSGILATAKPGKMPNYEPSKRRVTFHTGAIYTTFSSEEPDQLRGPELDTVGCDEFSTWRHLAGIDGLTAFDNAMFCLRSIGRLKPQGVFTCTPKRIPAVRKLEADALDPTKDTVKVIGGMMDNAVNLDQTFMDDIFGRYAGTALGEQEIDGRLAKTVEGAIFTEEAFNLRRIVSEDDLPELDTPVVAVDPSVGDGSGDECGIVVQALSKTAFLTEFEHNGITVIKNVRHGYVLEDASMSGPPEAWGRKVIDTAAKWHTRIVVAEKNQGHELVRVNLQALDPSIRPKLVSATKGKEVRAQPTASVFTQGRWHIVGYLGELEDQCTSWIPGRGDSPDRMDAMVWGQTHLQPAMGREPSKETFGGWLSAQVG